MVRALIRTGRVGSPQRWVFAGMAMIAMSINGEITPEARLEADAALPGLARRLCG